MGGCENERRCKALSTGPDIHLRFKYVQWWMKAGQGEKAEGKKKEYLQPLVTLLPPLAPLSWGSSVDFLWRVRGRLQGQTGWLQNQPHRLQLHQLFHFSKAWILVCKRKTAIISFAQMSWADSVKTGKIPSVSATEGLLFSLMEVSSGVTKMREEIWRQTR